jgi:hypothetical protein
MTVAYWTVPTLLALVCLYAGGLKVLRSPDHLRPMMGWTDTLPLRLVRAIGGLEVIAALGLILPAPPGIAPGPGTRGSYRPPGDTGWRHLPAPQAGRGQADGIRYRPIRPRRRGR